MRLLSKNVWVDAGFKREDCVVEALRADLARHLSDIIRKRNYSQKEAVKWLSFPQPTISKIMRGELTSLSVELLLKGWVRSGGDLDVAYIRQKSYRRMLCP
jgi:predicted XRE-type DNA-binding protein